MATQAQEFYYRLVLVKPNEKKVALHMTFHAVFIFSTKLVWAILVRDSSVFSKMNENFLQIVKLIMSMLVSLKIFLELTCQF